MTRNDRAAPSGTDDIPSPDLTLTGMPTWVKVFVVLGALLAVFVIVQVITGGEHGPGRHGG